MKQEVHEGLQIPTEALGENISAFRRRLVKVQMAHSIMWLNGLKVSSMVGVDSY
jgi:hypothetical protein